MLKAILTRMIASGERDLGVPAPFAYFLRDVAPSRLMRFSFIKWVEGTRRVTPADVYHASGLGSAMAEDCGPCMQIHVNLALRDGMAPDLLLALTRRRLDGLPGDIVQAFLFGYQVSSGEDASDAREAIRARWGDKGLAELAFAVAVARFYPGLKRGLGFAEHCERPSVPGATADLAA